MVRWDSYRFTHAGSLGGTGWPAKSPCKLEQSFPSLGLGFSNMMGKELGQTMAHSPFASTTVPPTPCPVPREWYRVSAQLPWDLLRAAGGLPLRTRGNKSWDRALASVGSPAKDLAGFPGGTPPHPGLARQVRHPCDPHHSLLSSPGRCGHRPVLPAPPAPLLLLPLCGEGGCDTVCWLKPVLTKLPQKLNMKNR